MKQLLLILSFTLGLAFPASSGTIIDAAKVLEKGNIIHKDHNVSYDSEEKRYFDDFKLVVAYQGILYWCVITGKTETVACFDYTDLGAMAK